jgi:hypothetical protein
MGQSGYDDTGRGISTICGPREVTFWLLALSSVLLMGVIAAGAAAGAAVSKCNNNDSTDR